MWYHWPQDDLKSVAAGVCAALRKPGGVALLPTETVYGLVARAADEAACDRIYRLKNRPREKRIGWFAADYRKLSRYGVILAGLPEKLAARWTPGPLTIIAPTASGSTQGFRIPDHPLLAEILKMMDEPLAQTSANASGHPDPLCAKEALAQLTGMVDCAVEGPDLPSGATGSTVVDASQGKLTVLRVGALDPALFADIL